MNCKPGDLAVIRGCVITTEYNGMLVEVVKHVSGRRWLAPDGTLHEWGDCGPSTAVMSLGSPFTNLDGDTSQFCVCDSAKVIPIRDPGDDAKDETLQWLPSPTREAA